MLIMNIYLFSMAPSVMLSINTRVVCHRVVIDPTVKPVSQRKHKVDEEKITPIHFEVQKLTKAYFVTNVRCPSWSANMVFLRKESKKCRMCVKFSDINIVCHKDLYPLLNINHLIGGSSS